MEYNKEEFLDDGDSRSKQVVDTKPNAWRVDDDNNPDENDLKGRPGDATVNPVMEGKPMGGQNFGENNVTPSGDDRNNPSQNAGYSNGYFARTEPSEEHPEDTNFTSPGQEARPDYGKAQSDQTIINELPKPEKVERGNGENDRPHKGNTYQEGTADN
ncbi:MAG: hypothetical protein M3N14_08280, partial [Bacteroidota bacterium]|nr:hypothetical protein [Bacteroidota bacterium]